MDKIVLKGVKIMGNHGVLASEKELGQPFEIDLEFGLNLSLSGLSDDLQQTVSYALVYEILKEEVANKCYDLIEKLAYTIVARVLAFDERIEWAEVSLKKPHAPIFGHFEYAGVVIRRERSEIDLSKFR